MGLDGRGAVGGDGEEAREEEVQWETGMLTLPRLTGKYARLRLSQARDPLSGRRAPGRHD